MHRTRMLIVDDDALVHRAIRRIFRRDVVDIVEKLSAEEALSELEGELEAGAFDVVLLDVRMPGVPDGVDFCRRLQAIDAARAPAVVMMTGDPHIARVLGASLRTTCLAKPFSAAELRAAVAATSARSTEGAAEASDDWIG